MGERAERRLKRPILCFTMTTIPGVVLLLVLEKYTTLEEPWLYMVPYFFVITTTMLVVGMFYFTCFEVGRLSQAMTNKLTSVCIIYFFSLRQIQPQFSDHSI
jgi:hypothetical protein